jgi:hypothetical protein
MQDASTKLVWSPEASKDVGLAIRRQDSSTEVVQVTRNYYGCRSRLRDIGRYSAYGIRRHLR